MLALIRITGFSACLAASLFYLSAPAPVTAGVPNGAKLTQERLPDAGEPAVLHAPAPVSTAGKSDRLQATTGETACADQAWPYIAADCLSPASGAKARGAVRTITVAEASGPVGSNLARAPVAAGKTR